MPSLRVLDAVAAVAVTAAALFTWVHYYPASPLIVRLGMPGPRADTDRRCGKEYRLHTWGRTPTRDIVCQNRRGIAGFWAMQEVNVDAITRRVTHAQRTLVPVDSLAWASARDSIRQVMSAGGGKAISCYPYYGKEPPWIVSEDAWQFSGYSVRLVSYRWTPKWQGSSGPPSWLLQLDGYPGDPPGCGNTARSVQRRSFSIR